MKLGMQRSRCVGEPRAMPAYYSYFYRIAEHHVDGLKELTVALHVYKIISTFRTKNKINKELQTGCAVAISHRK